MKESYLSSTNKPAFRSALLGCTYRPVYVLGFWLFLTLLTLLEPAPAYAQAARRFYNPAVATPGYAAHKRQLAADFARLAPANRQPATRPQTGAILPDCFEPLDKTTYTSLTLGDDDSTPLIPLGFTFTLYGTTYNSLYINSNGNISFTRPVDNFSGSGFPFEVPLIAPFWADVDMEVPGSGNVWFKIYDDRIVVTWDKVAYYGATNAALTNTFQVVLRKGNSSQENNVSFAYGDMQWTTGNASGGVDGFGGELATVGINRDRTSPYVQLGRFNLADASHPNATDPSGVYWLSDKCFSYNVTTTSNQAPTATGLPVNNTLTLELGQTVSIAPTFSGPEAGETVTLSVATNGLCQTAYTVTESASPTLTLRITGAACNVGTHTITIIATDNGSPVKSSRFDLTVIVINTTFTWTGKVSTDWNNPANWTNDAVPSNNMAVVIPANAVRMPVLFGTGNARSLTIAAGGALTIVNGAALILPGDITNNGTLTGDGLLSLYGPTVQTIGGGSAISIGNLTVGTAGAQLSGPVLISNILTLNGNLTTNGQPFTLLSTAQNTAMVVNNGNAVVDGAATVQRYILPLINAGPGYRHYSAPVRNATVGSLITAGFTPTLNTAYNNAAEPNMVTPFPTVFAYNQSRVTTSGNAGNTDFDKGWYSPEALTTPLVAGQGYTVNIPAAQKVAFTGLLNNGPLSRPVLTRGKQTQSGWQLMGNPYPAPLDWEVVIAASTGLSNAVYVYQSSGQYTGNFASYVNGVGSSRYIASGQAFFVRTAASNLAGTLNFTNAARLVTNNNPVFYRTSDEKRPLVHLDLVGNGQQRDAAYVYFQAGASAGFDSQYDAYKLPVSGQPYLALAAAPEPLSISGLPALTTDDVTVPLLVQVPVTGTYRLEATQLLNLPAGTRAYLRDAQTGLLTDLSQQPAYSFSLNNAFSGSRFSLLITHDRVLATAATGLAGQVALYPNPAHAAVFVELPASVGRQAVNLSLVNALGQAVGRYTLPADGSATARSLPLAGLAPGIYTVQITLAEGVVSKRLVIE